MFDEVVGERLEAEGALFIFFENELAALVADVVVFGAEVEMRVSEVGFAELAEGWGSGEAHV